MLCERCERGTVVLGRRAMPSFGRVWGQHRLGDLLCSVCGGILAAEGFAERLLRKHGQLARFGLVSAAGPLLQAVKRKVD